MVAGSAGEPSRQRAARRLVDGAAGRRRRGAGRRFLVVGDVLDGVIIRTSAAKMGDDDPSADIRYRPDGSAGNTAAWLGWLGADVDLVGRVGVDDVYRHATALRNAGVRPHIRSDGRTATGAVVTVHNDIGSTSMSDPAAGADVDAEDVDRELVAQAHVVHVTGAALLGGGVARLRRIVERTLDGPGRVSVDPSDAGRLHELGPTAFLDAVAGIDLLLPSAAEARALTGIDEPVAAARALTEHVPLVVVTLGAAGAVVARRGRAPQQVPAAPAVRPAAPSPGTPSGSSRAEPAHDGPTDSAGVGDAFAAGFICSWATDQVRVGAAAREGSRLAARALHVVGARPPV